MLFLSSFSQTKNSCLLQALIKLERWLDAVEFCNRALHVDGKFVKALSRRASAFVRLAGECSASVHATTGASTCAASTTTTNAAAVAAATTRSSRLGDSADDEVEMVVEGGNTGDGVEVIDRGGSTNDVIEVVKGGSGDLIDISSSTIKEDVGETIVGTRRGGEGRTAGEEAEENAFHESFGGRVGLLAQALLDLNTAVEVDPDGEDVRRQRDLLSQEIEEEKVCPYSAQKFPGGGGYRCMNCWCTVAVVKLEALYPKISWDIKGKTEREKEGERALSLVF